jgi:hypothetical protein
MHRPGEAVGHRGLEQDVLLVVVEVLVGHPVHLLAKRGLDRSLGVGLEGAEIMLEAGDQRHVLERALRSKCVQDVREHHPVDPPVLGLGLTPLPGAVEDMGVAGSG